MADTTAASGDRTGRASTDDRAPTTANRALRWGSALLALTGLLFVAHGATMLSRALLATRFEPGVDHLGGVTAAELARTNPAIQSYIDHLAVNVGGLMIVVGIAVVALVWYGVRRGERWAFRTTLVLPLAFLLFSVPVHRTVHFHFDALLHLGPAGVGAPVFVAGAVLTARGLRSPDAGR